jgi:hypothetical protein
LYFRVSQTYITTNQWGIELAQLLQRNISNEYWFGEGETAADGLRTYSTQIPGTATFLNRCGDIVVLGRTSAMLDLNSGLLKARLKCSADS